MLKIVISIVVNPLREGLIASLKPSPFGVNALGFIKEYPFVIFTILSTSTIHPVLYTIFRIIVKVPTSS